MPSIFDESTINAFTLVLASMSDPDGVSDFQSHENRKDEMQIIKMYVVDVFIIH